MPAQSGGGVAGTTPNPQAEAPLVRDELHRLGQVQRPIAWVGGNAQHAVAAPHVLVGHAKALGPKDEGHAMGLPSQRRQRVAGCPGRRTKVARRHHRGAGMGHAFERLGQASHDASPRQHVGRAAGKGDGVLARQHVRKARLHENQIPKAHHLHGPGSSTHIAPVAGVEQDEAGGLGSRLHGGSRPFMAFRSQPRG